jgi:putative transposase
MNDDGRRHPPHFPPVERYNVPIIIFVTVCTKDRKSILATSLVSDLLLNAWTTDPSWLVGRYVIMPDHIHLFCSPAILPVQSLGKWIRFWKSHVTRNSTDPKGFPVWQRHFWDTQLRRGESYEEKWQYVVENPVRAGLAKRSEDWPYQGELNILAW